MTELNPLFFRKLKVHVTAGKYADVTPNKLLESQIKKVLLPFTGTHISVLVFIDSMEIERLVVDEKLGAGNVDCADSNW